MLRFTEVLCLVFFPSRKPDSLIIDDSISNARDLLFRFQVTGWCPNLLDQWTGQAGFVDVYTSYVALFGLQSCCSSCFVLGNYIGASIVTKARKGCKLRASTPHACTTPRKWKPFAGQTARDDFEM